VARLFDAWRAARNQDGDQAGKCLDASDLHSRSAVGVDQAIRCGNCGRVACDCYSTISVVVDQAQPGDQARGMFSEAELGACFGSIIDDPEYGDQARGGLVGDQAGNQAGNQAQPGIDYGAVARRIGDTSYTEGRRMVAAPAADKWLMGEWVGAWLPINTSSQLLALYWRLRSSGLSHDDTCIACADHYAVQLGRSPGAVMRRLRVILDAECYGLFNE
jgi:hypothetical protein